jgi:protein-S-isoprenylcysteine O-methyltransferase Ste14
MLKVMIFVLVSAGIAFVSWTSFRNPRSHGFWRFFAFESFLLLTLLNIEVWFTDPFSTLQIMSWLLLLSSAVFAVHGFYLLHTMGHPRGGIENTTALVRRGAYTYVRHPLYSTLLLSGCGVFFKDPSLLAGILFLATSIFVVATAKTEELENLKKFGGDYAAYMQTTKMFIPFVF